MKAKEIRDKYINFFKRNNHVQVQGSRLIPENDSSVLFTTAGMQQFVPYLMGENYPQGRRIVDFQKCLRTNDIDEVGDNRHLTFFEMLGNWSLGDYFKEESIKMSYEFLTKELNIPVEKISVTCFEGDEDCPRDELTAKVWEECGIPKERIYFKPKSENWWIAGETGPCGSDTEMFYDTGKPKCSDECDPSCDCGKYVEIWNNVFMEYFKDENGKYSKLKQHNVDTGMGLERITMILQGKETPFDTELFSPMMEKLKELATQDIIESRRLVSEHLRSAIMIITDGCEPSNIDRGYILRRLIRRAIRHLDKLGIDLNNFEELVEFNIDNIKELYPEVEENKQKTIEVMSKEKDKFIKTLQKGKKEFNKAKQDVISKGLKQIPSEIVFKLYDTYGFPPEMTKELAIENGLDVNLEEFEELFKKHQEISKKGQDKKFKGGLGSTSDKTIKYHTATHLLHQALRDVLGDHVKQAGSNITEERMRFDFTHPQKMSKEEIQKVEEIVNQKISEDLKVQFEEMKLEDAKQSGAIGLFLDKYEDKVLVYSIGDYSKEICGGPHVEHTGVLGRFKIKKEESSSAGVRRIKAVLIDE